MNKKRYFFWAVLMIVMICLFSLCKQASNKGEDNILLLIAAAIGALSVLFIGFYLYSFIDKAQKSARIAAEKQAQSLSIAFQRVVEDNQKCKEAYIKANYVFTICCMLPQLDEKEKMSYLKKNKEKIVNTLNEVEEIYRDMEEKEEITYIIENIRNLLVKHGI